MGLPVIGSTRPWSRWHVTALVAAALGYAWVGGGLRPFSWPAMVSTTLGGLAILIPAWRRGRSPASVRASHVGLVAWTLWLIAATGWELWALSMHPRSTHPTISSLLDTVVETHPGRSVAVLAWLALGWRGTGRTGSTPTAYLATVMSHPAGRWLVLLLWMWVGWHFFVR